MYDLYYSPEKFDLEEVAEVDTGESYEFDKLVVWRRLADHALFWQTDSGCSCPTPFDNVEGVGDLRPIASARDLATFLHELVAHCKAGERLEDAARVAGLVKGHLR